MIKNIFFFLLATFTLLPNAQAEITCGRVVLKKGVPTLSIRRTANASCPKGFTLVFNNSQFEAALKAQLLGGPAVQGVSAGGDLTGSYPNPTLGLNTVGPANLRQMPGVKIVRNSVFVVATNTATPVEFTGAEYDTSGFYDPSSPNIITVPISGLYLVTGQVNYVLDATATGARTTTILKNGSSTAVSSWPANASNFTSATTTILTRLNVGDTISLRTAQNSGSNKSTINSNGGFASLQLQWMSP